MEFPPTFPQISRCAYVMRSGKKCGREIARINDPNGDFWQHTYVGVNDLPPLHDAVPECDHKVTDEAGVCRDCGRLSAPRPYTGLEPLDIGPEDVIQLP